MNLKRLPSIISVDSKKDLFTLDLITTSECTSSCFGHDPIPQVGYHCIYCDPKKKLTFCQYCYDHCHSECRRLGSSVSKKTKLKSKESIKIEHDLFACDCGVWLKHIVKPIEKKELFSCPLSKVDQEFLSDQIFYCDDDQMRLCSMCYFICHKDCDNKRQFSRNDLPANLKDIDNKVCECKDANHTIFNEFTFQIPIFDYQTEIKTTFWPIQMINLMFSTGTIFKELNTLFKDTIVHYNPHNVFNKEHPFPYLLEQFSNTFNRKFKTFYYHENISDMFPFEPLVDFMKNMNVKNQEMALVKFRLMFILLFAHLKKDFMCIKTYTSIDFQTSQIAERLAMRKFIYTKSSYTKAIHDKYHFGDYDCGILRSIALEDFCPFMEIGIQKNLLNVLEFQDELEIGLKFICFILKKMLLSLKDLKELIKILYGIHEKFITGIKFTDLDIISTWLDLFNAFAEIFYMIAASYNDLVVEDYLKTGRFDNSFIHCKSEHGSLLYKMIVKSCLIVTKHYKLTTKKKEVLGFTTTHMNAFDDDYDLISEGKKTKSPFVTIEREREIEKEKFKKRRINPNGVPFKKPDKGILFSKVLNLFHESLKIFSITDNRYYYQLQSLSKQNLLSYTNQCDVFDSIALSNEKTKKVSKMENIVGNLTSYESTTNSAYQLNTKLEELLHKLFLNSYDDTIASTIGLEFLSEYSNYIKEIANKLDEYIIPKPNLSEAQYKFIFQILDRYEYMNSFLIKSEINFNYSKLIYELILSNIDDTSLKILVFFSDRRYPRILSFDILERIISFLSLFLLTEEGTRYFLSGKTLSRLNKLFHRHSLNKTEGKSQKDINEENMNISLYLLSFIEYLCRAVKKYNIDLTSHKVLLRFKKNLISHLTEFSVLISNKSSSSQKKQGNNQRSRNKNSIDDTINDIDNDNDTFSANDLNVKFKSHFNTIMKIFNYLSPFYQQCHLAEINEEITNLFLSTTHNFYNPDNFYPYYYRELDDKGFPISSNASNRNDDMLTKRTNNEDADYEERRKLLLSENRIDFLKKNTNSNELDSSTFVPDKQKIDLDLFFSYFKLFGKRNSFVRNSVYTTLEPLNKFFDFDDGDEKAMLRLFKCEKLKLKEKIIMLNVMHKLFFIERISKDNMKYMNKQITSKEYLKYLRANDSSAFPSISNDTDLTSVDTDLSEIDTKLNIIKRIEMLIKIYISEIEFFPLNISGEKRKNVIPYIKSILFGIKHICDFYYLERNLWNKPFILFYSLATEFLPKTELFIHILTNEENCINSKNMKAIFTNDEKTAMILEKIKCVNFDLFNRDEIYKYMSNALDIIFKKSNINYDFSLVKFLDVYDTTQEMNFTPFSLIETKDYEFFYEEQKMKFRKEIEKDELSLKIEEITTEYVKEFLDINKTNYLSVIESVGNDSNKVNYRKNIVDYFKTYLNSESSNEFFTSLLCLMTKTSFYDTTPMQKNFKVSLDDKFFTNFNKLIQKNVYECFILCKNIYEADNFINIATETKLILQFLQLLGEDFCTDFHEKIFCKVAKEDTTIFENVILSLEQSFVFINYANDIEAELPYDKLIVLTSNLIDFIVEFIVTKKEYSSILQKEIDRLFFTEPRMIEVITKKCDIQSTTRMKILSLVKIKFIQLLISYIQNGKKVFTMKKLLENNLTPIELYNEILYNFRVLIYNLKKVLPKEMKHLLGITDNYSFVKYLIYLYINESKFRETLELTVCFNLYILIKIYETKYHKMDIKEHFRKMQFDETKINSSTNLSEDDENDINWNINSTNAFRIYTFMEELVLFVEVKTEGTMDPTEETSSSDCNVNTNEHNDEIAMINQEIMEDSEDKKTDDNIQITFFVRPFLTYFISKQTKMSFENNVDRETATAKYMGLINSSDYFLLEMAVNRNITNQRGIAKFLSDIEYTILEWINFLFIIIHNVTLIVENYKSWTVPDSEYEVSNENDWYEFATINLVLSIVQIIYIVLVLAVWFKYKFNLYYENNLLKDNNMTFIYRQKCDCGQKKISKTVRSFFTDNEGDVSDLLKDVNKDIPIYNKIYIAVFDSVLLNREICILVYNVVLLILYFCTQSNLCLVIPTLFIANISPTLFAIFKAIKNKWVTLCTILLFTYLFVYIFMWVTYYFLADNFIFEDVIDIQTGTQVTEAFCYSSIQCWMFMVNYGIRAGGGIADALGKISFKTDYQYFILRFFYDMLFHLFIVLILLNVFLGIIVDAFAELRNLNWQREKDMKSICFVCQLTSDDCLARNLDFEEHVTKTHNLWNYVYFLTYLHLGNVNDFNRVKKYVWDKLGNQDYSWIPLENSKKEE